MEPEGQTIISRHGRFFARGQAVFSEGEPALEMYLVHKGRVRVVRRVDGEPVCLEVLGEGDFFGERALLAPGPRAVSAFADEDTWLVPVDAATLRGLLSDQPEVAWRFVGRLAERLESLEERLLGLITRAERGRVAEALYRLAGDAGDGQVLPLDPVLLATRAGVLLDRAERDLAQLERTGVLARGADGAWRLASRRALEDYVEYCALKARFDPLHLDELATFTGLGLAEVEALAEKVIRRRLGRQASGPGEHPLHTPLQRYLELKLRFEFTQPARDRDRGARQGLRTDEGSM
ncbi:MAG TPA: Crp/Fnr family transcriptional regulator [Myxococcota bacterium]|nr:Crp/Fnr family transcriptional regulator [Myxococcota bacterium]HRY93193.1 Crp/Fnr family transcriptional regulator [Myxococcota bacterium]